jgi:hypothetical protein
LKFFSAQCLILEIAASVFCTVFPAVEAKGIVVTTFLETFVAAGADFHSVHFRAKKLFVILASQHSRQ